jgi:hypothetical protein
MRTTRRCMGLALALVLAACGPSDDGADDDTATGDGGAIADADPNRADRPPLPENSAVYAHSDSTLFKVDPDSLDVTEVGPFAWPGVADSMTDIAIDKSGYMVGISFDRVYAVNTLTASTTYLADLDREFNGLSFVPAQEIDPTGEEVLVASALDGSFYEIDPGTGASTIIGNYGGGLTSSGDIVSVSGFGTVATVKQNGLGNDLLARVDPTTGVATVIGDTGVTNIWGVGFWENKVFGFTSGQQFVLIDVTTGDAQLVESGAVSWWGAGVTTSAPIIE